MARDDRTEKATPKHRKLAREKGQVARSPDLSGSVVYAMQVTRILSMRGYDAWSARHPRKRPDPSHADPRRAVGDSVYDFASDPPAVRPGVHTEAHRALRVQGQQEEYRKQEIISPHDRF